MKQPVLKHETNEQNTNAASKGARIIPPSSGISFVDHPVQKKENNTGLPDQLKSGVEHLSGIDISDVKVHYNSSQPAQLNAHAYAQGNQIHIAPGQEKHLPHEAWHVVQQKQRRVRPTMQMKGNVNINDDKALEKEADLMGGKALQIGITQRRAAQAKNKDSTTVMPVMQFLMTGAAFTAAYGVGPVANVTVTKISLLLDKFHNDSAPLTSWFGYGQAYADRRLRQLDLIEHNIYSWLDQNRAIGSGIGQRAVFEALLNEIQIEHRQIIDYIHNHNLNLFTPDRHNLTAGQRTNLDNDWNTLRNGTGNVHLTDTSPETGLGNGPHTHPAFLSEMRAIHARILSRPQGRALMHQILAGVAPAGAGGVPVGHQASVVPYHPDHIAAGISGAEANARHTPFAYANTSAAGAYIGSSGNNSASVIGMEAGMTDSQNTNADAIGAGANQLASPAFIVYAHEMIHAMHNMQGDNRRNVTPGLYSAGALHNGWTNEEERSTISGIGAGGLTENAIRAEHGLLTPRVGH